METGNFNAFLYDLRARRELASTRSLHDSWRGAVRRVMNYLIRAFHSDHSEKCFEALSDEFSDVTDIAGR
eukprot:12723828-Alexandrium_andersonii.AAC.1